MTPTIDIADGFDENILDLTDVKGFAFAPFEFCPHFNESHSSYLKKYMDTKNTELYLCKDGDGIFCGDDGVKLFGEASKFTV